MHDSTNQTLIAKILSAGAFLTTILVISGSVTDPVNTPKLVALGVTGFAALGVLVPKGLKILVHDFKAPLILVFLFISSMGVAVLASGSPLTQNIYGSYGRNNGLLTYIFLASIFLASLLLTSSSDFILIVKALLAAGLVNVTYCLWAIVFGDFIGWYNPYGNILGTFGNPNFIGSFLGIFFTAYLAFALRKSSSSLMRYSLILVLPITGFEIYKSHAIQGRVVAALGVGILGFMLIRSRFNRSTTLSYVAAGMFLGILALLGALQIGPLSQYIYKTSVSLRGQYWLAGWNTGLSRPFTGVGMDSFGDWYRRSRDIHALELPGVNTVVNAAHNVPMDMFAFGGLPLLFTYIAIMGLAAISAARLILRSKKFDPIFSVLFTAWMGYQVQSVISINQIGLAIWGWLLSGCLIAYERKTRGAEVPTTGTEKNGKSVRKSVGDQSFLVLTGTLGGILGLILALPPLVSDSKWKSAQSVATVAAIEATMNPSLYNPQNSYKYLSNIQALEASNLFESSHKFALEAIAWNSESYDLWKILYLLKNSTSNERALALQNMIRLDPLNPDVTSTK